MLYLKSNKGLQGWSAYLPKGGDAMEVYQALSLMFTFGMFIIALLNFLNKK
ncbi:putative holin-like toxin [Paenibacillus sp. CAA11]|uniref:putative holin-like toxin n=1 Tax=Paenibacillus sp. CAA11 TaxID=1532905 RepID=UPI002D78711C|nr:putative holin-like toxin [Paenibacillus sp. CAA11]